MGRFPPLALTKPRERKAMATLKERILALLDEAPQPLDDDQIAGRLGVIRQAVNQACRQLQAQGQLSRATGPMGKIVNGRGADQQPKEPVRPSPSPVQAKPGMRLTEDEVKEAVRAFLVNQGYRVTVAWGRGRGADIDARREQERIIIEAKAEVANPPQQVNYFLNALGELVQRMSDPVARYGLALPDNKQYRGLVQRLPVLARERLRLGIYFVKRAGIELHVTVSEPPGPTQSRDR